MTRLQQLFQQKQSNILNIYTTAGFPNLHDTVPIMKALQDAGTDIIELGMPYSDPLADGETIQKSSAVAINNGMSIEVLLQQLNNVRDTIHVPIVLMGYLNPVLQFGFEKFCMEISSRGVDALIIPDLPLYEFETMYKIILEKYKIDLIYLVTPLTDEARIRYIDSLSSGFLYAVTSSSTTGTEQDFDAVRKYLQYLTSLKLNNPILAGFGVKDKVTFGIVSTSCNGGIIGSAFIKALAGSAVVEATTAQFVKSIRS